MFLKAQCREAARVTSGKTKAKKRTPLTKDSPATIAEPIGHGAYVLPILVREAFESPKQQARIPVAVMRERLKNLTEPATGFPKILRELLGELALVGGQIESWEPPSPMSVEEACKQVVYGEEMKQLVQLFLEICQKCESSTGHPCLIEVGW